jgi:hypothetical protein
MYIFWRYKRVGEDEGGEKGDRTNKISRNLLTKPPFEISKRKKKS